MSRRQGGAALDYHNNELFSQRLRSEMDRTGLDAATLARELGFSKAAVSNWLNQRNSAQSYALERLGNYFGVEPAWLAGAIPYRTIPSVRLQHVSEGTPHAEDLPVSARSSDEGSEPASSGHALPNSAVREHPEPSQSGSGRNVNAVALTDGDRMVINAYLNAPPDSKEAIQSFVRSLLNHR